VVEILLAASVEMAEAAGWYAERVDGLGQRVLLEAEATFARVDGKAIDRLAMDSSSLARRRAAHVP
jgi:hypothetical protein